MKSINPNRQINTKRTSPFSLQILLCVFFIFLFLFSGILLYCTLVFPRQLSASLRQEIIRLYTPTAIHEEKRALLITLPGKPDAVMQQIVYDYFLQHYGVETVFREKNSECFLEFFRGYSRLSTSGKICLRWNPKAPPMEFSVIKQKMEEKKKISKGLPPKQNGKRPEVTLLEPTKKSTLPIKKTPDKKNKAIAKIAVVLDDAGYNYPSAQMFYQSRLPVTIAMIPDLPHSPEHYQKICQSGMDLILHIPMEPEKGQEYVENQAILVNMTDEEITNRLNLFFQHYPNAIGMNNHMGSRAVKDLRVITAILNFAKNQNIFWLDSKTTPVSVSGKIAQEKKVPYLERDVFLDNENTEEYAEKAMEQLIKIAKKRGYAIGIGHIQSEKLYPVLERFREKQEELGITFVPLPELLSQ